MLEGWEVEKLGPNSRKVGMLESWNVGRLGS